MNRWYTRRLYEQGALVRRLELSCRGKAVVNKLFSDNELRLAARDSRFSGQLCEMRSWAAVR